MTSNRRDTVQEGLPAFIRNMSPFERIAATTLAGVVAAGVVAASVFPPSGGTGAPRAAFDLESVLRLEPVPTVPVIAASLEAPGARAGLTVAEVRKALSYDLDNIAQGDALVPRVFIKEMPADLDEVAEVSLKKSVFFKSVLPMVLHVNEELLRDRARLQDIHARKTAGEKIKSEDRLWLAMMSDRYEVERGNIKTLLRRVDIIPPSLALAQAAKESGWGTSRFAVEGNALFGQWTWSEEHGIAPKDREEGEDHLVRQFDTPMDSVRAYMRNLNTHPAYRELRAMRAEMRAKDEDIDGIALAEGLERYSELGMEYVERIRSMISYNELSVFDDAKLSDLPSI